jgi:hypothetical protein
MRRAWLLLGLLTVGCVDLSTPPELARPEVTPGGDGEAPDMGPAPPDAGGPARPEPDGAAPGDLAITPPPPLDAGATGRDAAIAPDTAVVVDGPAVPADAPLTPDAAATPDQAMAAPDAPGPVAPPPDAAAPDIYVPPDLAPDVFVPPDTAPDLAPDTAPDTTPDVSPDLGPPPLVVDDFQTSPVITKNNLGSDVTWDNQTCNRVSGELVCAWNGMNVFHDFIETLNNWCAYDARAYSKLRFRLRASAAGKLVHVYAGVSTGTCPNIQSPQPLLGTLTTTTTMTTYEFSLTGLTRERLAHVELNPRVTDGTQYFVDDVQLVP